MIVVTTPTGRIGRQLLDRLNSTEQPVRVIARHPDRLPAHIRNRVDIVVGSHDDVDTVMKAFTDADTVFWAVPPNSHADSPLDHYRTFTDAACEAIGSTTVKRVIGVSSLGHKYRRNAGLLTAAFKMDELIESTGVHYRSLRMPSFMDNLLEQVDTIANDGVVTMLNAPDRPLATVATGDIAAVAAAFLLDHMWTGQDGVSVVGDTLSPNEMTEVIAEALGRPIRYGHSDPATFKTMVLQYGMTNAWAQGIIDMAAAQDNGVYDPRPRPSASRPASATGATQSSSPRWPPADPSASGTALRSGRKNRASATGRIR